VGLRPLRDQIAMNISHGDQRLLEIGITLAMKPELLMLDEPLAGLAAKERVKIAGLIRALAGEHTVILIDHDIDQILNISDRITVLAQGKVIAEGSPDEIQASPLVQEAYIGGFDRKHLVSHPPQRRTDVPLLEVERINTSYGKSHILHDVSDIYPESWSAAGAERGGKTDPALHHRPHAAVRGEILRRRRSPPQPEQIAGRNHAGPAGSPDLPEPHGPGEPRNRLHAGRAERPSRGLDPGQGL
jgi:hypothetical protein